MERGDIVRGDFVLGGYCPRGYCPGDIVRGDIVRGDIVLIPYPICKRGDAESYTGNFLTCLGRYSNPGSGGSQLASSGNTLYL